MSRVLIVEDHRVLRESLGRTLTAHGFDVVGEAGDGQAALAAVAELQPEVVLVDISLPTMDGIELTRILTAEHPESRVVMLTMFADTETIRSALGAGADGYLLKDASVAEIAEVISAVADGNRELSLGLARKLLKGDAGRDEMALSRREVEVLQLIAQGASTETVARRLFISVKTVKNHLANIYDKMDTTDRTQAVVAGLKLGLVRLR
jgi:DNA-binding NarL/FixJ family response regulator